MMAIIVPYRNREEHLNQFISHMREFLKEIPHAIYLIEQSEDHSFNRAKLLNIGFTLAKKDSTYVCFHDVDMLPIKADYSFPKNPTHLATKVEQFQFDMPYKTYFGGVTLFNIADFEKVNGFSNQYFGWGAEDDDLRTRCNYAGLSIDQREGYFSSLPHTPASMTDPEVLENQEKLEQILFGKSEVPKEGLKTLEYKLLEERHQENFHHFVVKI